MIANILLSLQKKDKYSGKCHLFPRLFVHIIMLFLMLIVADIFAQQAYQGPAFGSIDGGSQFVLQQGTEISESHILNREGHRTRFHPPIQRYDDQYNKTPALAPLKANEFFDPAALMKTRQEVHAPFMITNFLGSLDPGNYIPPDPHIAVGPNHAIIVDNSRIIIFDKKGNHLKTMVAEVWYSNIITGENLFDCQIIYDHFEQRWVMEWMFVNDDNRLSSWLISVSDDADPFGTWCNYDFPNHLNGMEDAGNWGDYPKIAYDQQAFYISGRQFKFGDGLDYCKLRIIPKFQLYEGNCGPIDYIDFWDFRDPNNVSRVVDGPPIAATHFDTTSTAYLVVDAPYNTSTFITLWTIENPLSINPIVSAINIPVTATLDPPDANQLGGGEPGIDSGRRAYRNAVYKNGNLWTATAVAGGTNNNYAFTRYLRLDVLNKTVLEDISFGADNFYYLYPAIMVDEDDNLTIVFSRSADNEYAAAAYTGRRATDPPGLAPSVVFKEGEANYVKTFSGNRNRWGDYMGVALDPVNTNTVWGFVEYAASPANTWGNWIGAFSHQYAVSGVIRDAVTKQPIEFAALEVPETGTLIVTDSSGAYSFASPLSSTSVNVKAFAYQDTSFNLELILYNPDTIDVELLPEIESMVSGQVKDLQGTGIPAELHFYARGNPYPGPLAIVQTDSNGFYELQTIIGVYDLEIFPKSPYPFTKLTDIQVDSQPLDLDISLNPADVLLVDDDNGQFYETFYTQLLSALSISYHLWDISEKGRPTADIRQAYPEKVMIWFTGDTSRTPLSTDEEMEITDHLNNGGKLFLTGQDVAEYSTGVGLLDTLGIQFLENTTISLIRGVVNDVVSDRLILIISGGEADNQFSQDAVQIIDSLTTRSIFHYGTGTTLPAGIRYADIMSGSKAVYLGFGFEAINDTEKQQILLQRVYDYLQAPISSVSDNRLDINIPRQFELSQNYPNPFNPATTIPFAVPVYSKVNISVYNNLGQLVRNLTDTYYQPGYYEVSWDGKNRFGLRVSSGIYFYYLESKRYTAVRKLLFLK